MSVHMVLGEHITTLEAILSEEAGQHRLNQLPSLSAAATRTLRQGLLVELRIGLMQDVFGQEPACPLDELHLHLQKPLSHLASPEEVFVKSQEDLHSFQSQLGESEEQLQALGKQLEQQLDSFKNRLHQEMDMVRAFLKIPDLLSGTGESAQVRKVLDRMSVILEQARPDPSLADPHALKRLADEWKQLYAVFSDIRQRLSFDRLRTDYALGDDTIAAIERLTLGQTLTLDKLTPQTLHELQRFQQFCSQIALGFTAQN